MRKELASNTVDRDAIFCRFAPRLGKVQYDVRTHPAAADEIQIVQVVSEKKLVKLQNVKKAV